MTMLLDVRGLRAFYGSTQALFGIDLTVAAGGITTIIGANGAGKTTTLRAICGTIRTMGEVFLSGVQIDRRATEDRIRQGIGHVPDGRGTFTDLTVEENLRLGAWIRRDAAGIARDLDRVFGYFPRLRERRGQMAGTLSGGEQQMLAISRALMSGPRLLLLDEPSFGLAPLVVAEIFEIMRRINEVEGIALLLVEQNAALALELADTAVLIESGRVVLSGSAALLRNDDSVRRAYLGN
ncbi:ABC transporter ATP-binding protein [Tistrella mobilis]|uniref:ABC transporter related protein n=1 Tax=Tistrella mobilis (strain KA081020-065) TaxID=1110502 RepID=I3TT12_TISMK|nr:ABC transporter ATP-binding protein [Tistrella mobilis]AFK55900.1 ABC transporter related protein [Tistrella mobilis KA081020-065]